MNEQAFLDTYCDRWKTKEERRGRTIVLPLYGGGYSLEDFECDNPDSIDTFIQAIVDLIDTWISVHLIAKCRFQMKLDNIAETWEECISSRSSYRVIGEKHSPGTLYFGSGALRVAFDWEDAAIECWVEDTIQHYQFCVYCGGFFHWEEYHNGWCDEQKKHKSVEESSEEVPELYDNRDPEFNDIYERLSDCCFSLDIPKAEIYLEDALLMDGFNTYYDHMYQWFGKYLWEMVEALKEIIRAQTTYDLLQAVMMGTHLRHVGGQLIDGYPEDIGLDSEWLDQIQQEGLVSHFSQDCIDAWLACPLCLPVSYYVSNEMEISNE